MEISGFLSVHIHARSVLQNIKRLCAVNVTLSLLAVVAIVFCMVDTGDTGGLLVGFIGGCLATLVNIVRRATVCAVFFIAVSLSLAIHGCRKKRMSHLRMAALWIMFNMFLMAASTILVIINATGLYILSIIAMIVPSAVNLICLGLGRYYVDLAQDQRIVDETTALASSQSDCAELIDRARKNNWFIEFDRVSLIERIGSGAFGEVWRANWKKQEVAVKKMHQIVSPQSLEEFMREAALLSTLRHPNIVQFWGASSSGDHLFIVTEFAQRGNLFDLVHNEKTEFSLAIRAKMALDAARGIGYLHSLNPIVIHRDVKSPNMLVMSDFTVKVTDFGTSKWIEKTMTMTANIGSPMWSAPEVLTQSKYSEKADVYSWAIVLWELLTRQDLYPGKLGFQLAIEVGTEGLRPEIPEDVPVSQQWAAPLREVMVRAWSTDPHDRPPFTEIITTLESTLADAPADV